VASNSGFAINVALQDNASKGLDAINKRIAALQYTGDRLNKSQAKFGETSGINRVAEGMSTLGDRALGAARSMERLAGPTAAITGAATLAGLAELERRWGAAGNAISKTAYILSAPVGKLSALHGAAELAGSSIDAMDSSLAGLQSALDGVRYHTADGPLVALLNQFKISADGAGGGARKAVDALADVADAVAQYKDPDAQKNFLKALGMSPDLLPLLKNGSAGLQKELQRMQGTGGVLTSEMAEHATKMNASWVELGKTVDGVGNRIVDSWSGTTTSVVDNISHWIQRNEDLKVSIGKISVSYTDLAADLGLAIGGLATLRPALWILRGLGLATLGEAGAAAAAGGLATLGEAGLAAAVGYEATHVGSTQSQALEDKIMGGTNAQRNPEAVVGPADQPPSTALGDWWRRAMPSWVRGSSSATETGDASRGHIDLSMSPTKRGFLETIAGPESGGRYDIKNGWRPDNDNGQTRFREYRDFPPGVAPGGTSTAAGKYQITQGTWTSAAAAAGLDDFSPASQDKAAWYIAATRYRGLTGGDLEADLRAGGNDMKIATALGPTWPSLPGGSQSHQSLETFDASLKANTAAAEASVAPTGHIAVEISHRHAPPGTSANAVASGQASVRFRTETGMPTGF
jgi:hypothetical protein